MNYKGIKALHACALVLVPWLPGFSQLSDTLFPLEEVRIVTDRLGLELSQTGRNITVIRSEEISGLPVNSLDELLRYVPFMEVQSRGPFGAQADLLMRGSTFNQVLVLIDGMRINDPLTGHFNGNVPVPLNEISRIEVYRGPASAIYGPDAVGGVVNIVTKTFDQKGYGTRSTEGKLEAWYGQYNLLRSNSGINIYGDKWKAGAGVNYSASDGHPLDPDSLKGDFDLVTLSVSISGQLSDKVRLSFRTSYDRRLFNARYFYTASPFDLSREEVRKWWNQARLSVNLNGSSTLTLSAAYQSTRDSFLFNPAFPANLHRSRFQNYQLNHLFKGAGGFRIASGIQADNRRIFSTDRGNRFRWHTGGYLMVSKSFSPQFILTGGFRTDCEPSYGLELLPQVNLTRIMGKWTFRGGAGRSIRSADFTERYVSTGLEGPLSPGRNLGNPDLVAERSWSLEGGVDRKILSGLEFSLTGFYRFSRDLIDYVTTPAEGIPQNGNLLPGESYLYAGNIGLLNTGGLETSLTGRHNLSGNLSLDWQLSWQGLASHSDSASVSKYLAAHSRNLVQGEVGLNAAGFRIRMGTMYKNRDPETVAEINQKLTANYMLWNLRLDKFFLGDRLQFSLQVNNLLDENYSDILGAKMPGRWILGGITWNFIKSQ